MKQQNKVKKVYQVDDAEMLQLVKTIRASFLEDKADFILFDSDFNDPFAANWQTDIEAAEGIESDETLDDQAAQLVAVADAELENCRDKFQDSKYYIEKTFPDNREIWDEFGYSRYNYARQRPKVMVLFMENFHTVAEKYKVKLIAKGYLQPMINEIQTVGDALNAARQATELFVKNIPVKTRERIEKYNALWKLTSKVARVGKRIYKDDWAKYQRYLLYKKKHKAAKPDEG